jgi:PIN domain nuclease of toxin-antitoxin system
VTLLDAYALVAFLADEPATAEVEAILRAAEAGVAVVNLAEAIDITSRVHRVAESDLRAALEPLLGTAVTVVAQGEAAAWRAAGLRRLYYDRRASALSLADCLLLAAIGEGDEVATADPAVSRVARSEGLRVVALPDSTGARP